MLCKRCKIKEAESLTNTSSIYCLECKFKDPKVSVDDLRIWTQRRKNERSNEYNTFLINKRIEEVKGHKILSKAKRVLLKLPDIKFNYKLGGRDWTRELIRARDGYKCRKCGQKWIEGMRRFDIHHLDNDSEKSRKYETYDEIKDNSITLCHRCHMNLPSTKKKMKSSH